MVKGISYCYKNYWSHLIESLMYKLPEIGPETTLTKCQSAWKGKAAGRLFQLFQCRTEEQSLAGSIWRIFSTTAIGDTIWSLVDICGDSVGLIRNRKPSETKCHSVQHHIDLYFPHKNKHHYNLHVIINAELLCTLESNLESTWKIIFYK